MAFDITKRRASGTGRIALKNGDQSPMLDDDGEQLYVTVHGPGSKVHQQAEAERNRKLAVRMRKAGGRAEAALDEAREDAIEFLVRITVSFDGWEYPGKFDTPADMFRATYADDDLGYIRDQIFDEARDWAAFTKSSAKS